jgi:uncharacterized membrane protein required for colicin V production
MNALDIVLLLIFSFFTVSGFSQGLVTQLADLAGFFIALYLAAVTGGRFALFLLDVFHFVPESFSPEHSFLAMYVINMVGFILVYFLVRLAFRVFGKVLNSAASLPVIGTFNALGGALIGGLKGIILLVVIISILSFVPTPYFQDLIRDSVLSAVAFSYTPVVVDKIRDVITIQTPLTV